MSKHSKIILAYGRVKQRGEHMLNIILEFRKGILFVRLRGKLVKSTAKEFQEEVIQLIQKNGIHTTVVNVKELEDLDLKGMNTLLYCYESCKQNKGTALLCGVTNESVKQRLDKGRVFNYMSQIKYELDALKKVKV